uniref:SprT-like domain-containing protein n=1 Tax=Parastrongyloides trichosuri TaxID=131310 RepID=A0A0N4Z935_PARTI
MNLVDPQLDFIDPNPDIFEHFNRYNQLFFNGKLGRCEVKWSKRMTLCAGVCRYKPRNGECVISLSEPLLKLRPRRDFVQTLLHEMIHAYLFVTERNQDRDGHGPEFQMWMHKINSMAGTEISIYHSFHEEVRHYKNHWWKCNGPCSSRPPFYGLVKRAMNREPSKNDYWWGQHEATCGGKFIKIKEPEGYKKKEPSKVKDVGAKLTVVQGVLVKVDKPKAKKIKTQIKVGGILSFLDNVNSPSKTGTGQTNNTSPKVNIVVNPRKRKSNDSVGPSTSKRLSDVIDERVNIQKQISIDNFVIKSPTEKKDVKKDDDIIYLGTTKIGHKLEKNDSGAKIGTNPSKPSLLKMLHDERMKRLKKL